MRQNEHSYLTMEFASLTVVLALEKEEAKEEVFNIAGPAPFSYQEEAERVAEVLGKPCLKVRTSKMFSYEISIAKARSLLGYDPKFDAHTMITEALETQRSTEGEQKR